MAVPVSCSQYVSPKEKMLLRITISNMCRKSEVGKSFGSLSAFSTKNSLKVLTPVVVSMFVYIDFASAVKIKTFSGRCRLLRSCITAVEFFVYDWIRGSKAFILKSNQVEKTDNRLLMQLTTGLRDIGVL